MYSLTPLVDKQSPCCPLGIRSSSHASCSFVLRHEFVEVVEGSRHEFVEVGLVEFFFPQRDIKSFVMSSDFFNGRVCSIGVWRIGVAAFPCNAAFPCGDLCPCPLLVANAAFPDNAAFAANAAFPDKAAFPCVPFAALSDVLESFRLTFRFVSDALESVDFFRLTFFSLWPAR